MEKRIGTEDGDFIKFIKKLAEAPEFLELAPIPSQKSKRAEHPEYVLRFFAYRENYQNFDKSVREFLNNYLDTTSKDFNAQKQEQLEKYFFDMLNFIKKFFPNGFRKSTGAKSVSRIRYEATSVGCSLALAQDPNLMNLDKINTSWAYEEPFLAMMRSDASNSKPKLIKRVEFVRDHVLGNINV